MIREISESLPFGVIAALDKRNSTEVTEYVLLAPNLPYDYSVIENVEDYIHPYHVTLNIVKIKELISKIDEAIRFIGTPWEAEKGINIEYSIIEEHNITPLSINVEEWNSNFVFIFKGFSKTDQSFVKLGFLRSQKGNITYSYYLNKKMLMEFRLRLYKALEELKKMK